MNAKDVATKVSVFFILTLSVWFFTACREERPESDFQDRLPETEPLTWQGDLSSKMLDGANVFIEKKIDRSAVIRKRFWHRDFSTREAYEKSIELVLRKPH